mgnify:CR=1 FL=1
MQLADPADQPGAALFPVDGLAGYGTDLLARWLLDRPACGSFEGDILRHTMPSGVCSYCVGEQRVGSAFQQGVVGKINLRRRKYAVCDHSSRPGQDREAGTSRASPWSGANCVPSWATPAPGSPGSSRM